MEFLQAIKDRMPEHAKDIRLNLDGVIARSSLTPEDAVAVALAAAFAPRARRWWLPSRPRCSRRKATPR